MKIIIENNVFSEDEKEKVTVKAASKHFEVIEVKDSRLLTEKLNIPNKDISFWRGSFGLKSKLRQHHKIIEDDSKFNALNWLPPLKTFALNNKYFFLDAQEILRAENSFFPVFIKPVAGNKIFTGQIFENKEKYQTEFNFFTKNLNHCPYTICQISPPAKVSKEYRFVIINGEVVDGALYFEKGERRDAKAEAHHFDYVKNLIKNDFFLNFFNFVLDIDETDGKISLVEINSIHTSSFYSCNLDLIFLKLKDFCNEQ